MRLLRPAKEMVRNLRSLMIRLLDIVLSLIALVVLSAPLALLALMIKSEDGGPVFYRQLRVGKSLKPFWILKFRSMTHDPHRMSGVTAASTPEEMRAARARFQTTDPVFDPRITRMGRLVRASHVDELPQFMNVLLGDMSIVGVRPDTPVQQVDYSPEYWRVRHTLRPGITGPAQLKSETATMEQRSALELKWIDNPSVVTYFAILFATVIKVVKRTGN